MIFVIATSKLKPGCKADFIAAAKANYENVRAEDGCIFYHLNEPTDAGVGAPVDPDECVYVECWESAEHLQKHLQQPHMKAFIEKVKDMRFSSSLKVVKPA
ncbi:MAG: antibiotic biosynthesis monooxygenase [Lentisphaeria bacterium]|nr:antibiotic biosynthesis monooxygenase [Lentisphaeria bacterium]